MTTTSDINKLKRETLTKLKNLAQNDLSTFENIIKNLNANAQPDEKFIIMLIMQLHKKCSSELLIALLYIIS